ncbi:MAG: hypothetical protein ACLR9J_08235 [Eubacterium sp.]
MLLQRILFENCDIAVTNADDEQRK